MFDFSRQYWRWRRRCDNRSAAPTGHVVALDQENTRRRSPWAGRRQEGRRDVTVVGRLAVCVVVHGEDVVGGSELHDTLEEAIRDDRARRIVGVVEDISRARENVC